VRSAREQIGSAAGSDEDQFAGLKSVDQDSVRFHMAVPVAFPFAAHGMDAAPRWQGAAALEEVHNHLELVEGFVLASDTVQISFKGRRRE
jgi:hypothetical protein